MSGIAAVSGQISSAASATASAPNALAAGAAGGTQGSGGVGKSESASAAGVAKPDASSAQSAGSSTSVQTSSFINSAQPNATIENMAALMLSLLLSKSDESKDKDDPWKMLAGMALLGAMANQNQGISMSQSTTVVSEAYSTGGTAAAATGGSVNIQG
ncbi:MAG: hypothetical protein K8U03_11350 [Planctomycetia bacterium]|nr:hypothetical protein [Planctomycetia bacterium]